MSDAREVEVWRTIPGYGDKYEASSHGRVRVGLTGAIKSTGVDRGYSRLTMYYKGRHTLRVHAVVAAAFIGPRPEGMETRHLDGDQSNNAPTNLAYGTKSENMIDRRAHGTARNMHTGKTHCIRGHEFTPENTRTYSAGKRNCKTCHTAAAARRYLERKTAR